MITLKELAEKCGVSIATISNVVNGKSNVSDETKKRILEVIHETGYQPNYMARTLRVQKTNTIGLIVEDICAFSSPKIIEGIMNTCEKRNYRCVLENLRLYAKAIEPESPEFIYQVRSAIDMMKTIKVDGLIYVAAHGHLINFFPENIGIPVIVCYGFTNDPMYPVVVINDKKAGHDATKYLIDHGHKKCAVLCAFKGAAHSENRLIGYRTALEEAGIPVDESMIIYGNWSRKSGYAKAEEILKTGATAVFCVNDLMAAGIYDYMRDHDMVPGKDLSIIGYDGREAHDFMYPKLTSMAIDLFGIGHYSADFIIRRIEDAALPKDELPVDCILDEGNSVLNIN